MRKDYCNPKKSIRKHLTKRKTNYSYLYFLFIFLVFTFGLMRVLLSSDLNSEASEGENLNSENVQSQNLDLNNVYEVSNFDTLFPRTINEDLLYQMIDQEELPLSPIEENFVKNH